VLIKQLVQCARDVRASAANTALATGGASLARRPQLVYARSAARMRPVDWMPCGSRIKSR
jgi:hypothetical protein